MHTCLRVVVVAILLCSSEARADGSLRCGGRLVSVGDARIDLLASCGEPKVRDRRTEEHRVREQVGVVGQELRSTNVVEDWTYDFGPSSFVRVVTLVNGRITGIGTRSYGYAAAAAPARIPRARCDPGMVHEGDGKLDVLARCGDPAMMDGWDEARGNFAVDEDRGRAASRVETLRIEVWTYDHGPNQFVRFVRFENGRVKEVTTGGHGYAD